jgi:cell division protease FtsH
VTENYRRAQQIVKDNLEKLKALAEALLEYETLDGDDIDRLFEGRAIERPPVVSRKQKTDTAQPPADAAKDEANKPGFLPGTLPEPEKA